MIQNHRKCAQILRHQNKTTNHLRRQMNSIFNVLWRQMNSIFLSILLQKKANGIKTYLKHFFNHSGWFVSCITFSEKRP